MEKTNENIPEFMKMKMEKTNENIPEFMYALRVKGTTDIFLKVLPSSDGTGLSPKEAQGELGALGVAKEEEVEALLSKLGYDINRYDIVQIRTMKNTTVVKIS